MAQECCLYQYNMHNVIEVMEEVGQLSALKQKVNALKAWKEH